MDQSTTSPAQTKPREPPGSLSQFDADCLVASYNDCGLRPACPADVAEAEAPWFDITGAGMLP